MRIIVYSRADAQKIPAAGRHAYISVTDSDQDLAVLPAGSGECVGVLRLAFDDVLDGREQGREIVVFNDTHATQVWDFWDAVKDRVDVLIVHCNGGQCRSPAIAAAIERVEIGDDHRWFATKRPNSKVYRTLLEVQHDRG
jgi:predicted protein tyrosine phosphatase